MILNIDRVFITDKLRDILIFESNFNFSNKLYFGIMLMEIVESSGVIPQEQHGVRSGNMSIEVELLISLFFDYVIQTRRNTELGLYYAETFMTV